MQHKMKMRLYALTRTVGSRDNEFYAGRTEPSPFTFTERKWTRDFKEAKIFASPKEAWAECENWPQSLQRQLRCYSTPCNVTLTVDTWVCGKDVRD